MRDAQGAAQQPSPNSARRFPLRFEILLAATLVVAGLVPLAIPYSQPGHQIAHDRHVPYMRVEALYRAIREAQLPPRWFPDFDGGYGSPYPSFYAMLFYYPAAALRGLGSSVGSAVELTAFAALVLSGATMFTFVTRRWGPASGLLAAVLYVYAPYHLTDAFERGAYSELAAFVWPPLIALSYLACLEAGGRRWVLPAAVSTAALILTHNLTSLIFLPSLAVLLVSWTVGKQMRPAEIRAGLRKLTFAAALGLSLSAFFWVPAVLEGDFVRLEYFLKFDYRQDFVGVRDLFMPRADNGVATFIGLPLAVLPVVALGLAAVRRVDRREIGLLAGLLALGWINLYMTTRFSAPVWKLFGPLKFVQFPWRFLSPATFYLAAAAGPVARLSGSTRAAWTSAILLGATSMLLFAPQAGISRRASVQSVEPSEICRDVWGTQDYRPAWSQVAFWEGGEPPEESAAAPVLRPCPVSPVYEATEQVEVLDLRKNNLDWAMTVRAPESTTVKLSQYYYPGWHVTVGGAPVAVRPTTPEGLISVTMPQGTHTVTVTYRQTLIQASASLITIASLPVTVWLLIHGRSAGSQSRRPRSGIRDAVQR